MRTKRKKDSSVLFAGTKQITTNSDTNTNNNTYTNTDTKQIQMQMYLYTYRYTVRWNHLREESAGFKRLGGRHNPSQVVVTDQRTRVGWLKIYVRTGTNTFYNVKDN